MLTKKMDSEIIELSRCRDGESVAEIKAILDAAGISYRVGSTATTFDITAIGSGSDAEVIFSVRRSDFSAARSAMENEFLSDALPDDYYLLTFSDEELAEILGKPSEWSAFDVAHARKMAEARGIDEAQVIKKREERIKILQQGKPASRTLLFFGWLFSALGGLIGLGIAWSICHMKEKTPEGEYYTYDARSREIGRPMLKLAWVMTGITLLLEFLDLRQKRMTV